MKSPDIAQGMAQAGGSQNDRPAHLPALDGLRGVAVLAVMAMHFTIVSPMILAPTGVVNHAVVNAALGGWSGVDLFFVLSGFLITGILYDGKGREGYFRNFYMRRVLRIFPLYFATLFFLFVLMPNVAPSAVHDMAHLRRGQVWVWTYLSNWRIAFVGDWSGTPPLTGHFWSLAVEEQFYLVWPWVVVKLTRQSLVRVCAGLIILAFVTRTIAVFAGLNPLSLFVMTPTRMDGLAAGALLALVIRSETDAAAALRAVRMGALIGALVLCVIALDTGTLGQFDSAMQTVGYSALALAFAGLLASAIRAPERSLLRRFLTNRALRYVGARSYALYVFHPIIVLLLFRVGFQSPPRTVLAGGLLRQVSFWAVGAALSMIAAEVSWQLLEKRCLALKRFFPRFGPGPTVPRAMRTV